MFILLGWLRRAEIRPQEACRNPVPRSRGRDRARVIRLRHWRCYRLRLWRPGASEPEIALAVVWVEVVAERGQQVRCVAGEVAAPDHPDGLCGRTRTICAWVDIAVGVPVNVPLPNIPSQIE